MKIAKKIQSVVLTALVACNFFFTTANAAVVDVDTGALMGIDDININGVLYDVDFVAGLWHEIDGIAAQGGNPPRATDFLLTSAELEIGLLEIKGLLDGSIFENTPRAVNGCNSGTCNIQMPYSSIGRTYDTERIRITSRDNDDNVIISVGTGTGTSSNSTVSFSTDTSRQASSTFGVWSLASVAAVPEPSTYAMLLAGGLLVLAARKRQTV